MYWGMRKLQKYVFVLLALGLLSFTPGIAQELKQEVQLKVFPNPSKGEFKVEVNLEVEGTVSAKIFDMTGKLVEDISSELQVSEKKVSADISLSEAKPGIVFLRIESGKQKLTKKLIIR